MRKHLDLGDSTAKFSGFKIIQDIGQLLLVFILRKYNVMQREYANRVNSRILSTLCNVCKKSS